MVERVLGRFAKQTLSKGFRTWIKFGMQLDAHRELASLQQQLELAKRDRDRLLIMRVVKRMQHKVLCVGFESLRLNMRVCNVLEKVRLRWIRGTTSRAFARWQEYRQERRYQRKLVGRVLARLRNGRQASAFRSWRVTVAHASRAQGLMDRVLRRMRQVIICEWL